MAHESSKSDDQMELMDEQVEVLDRIERRLEGIQTVLLWMLVASAVGLAALVVSLIVFVERLNDLI